MMMPAVIAWTWFLLTPTQQVVALNAAHVYIEADAAAVPVSAVLPANVRLSGNYHPAVQEMLRRSDAFRRQCSRIGRDRRLIVTVEPELLSGRSGSAASTTITRTSRGGIEAAVRLTGQGQLAELIAHEFEHILEQLDDVDLAAMASRSRTGVRALSELGHFETERAIAAGRRVFSEVANARR
jgi:hypothetical protein